MTPQELADLHPRLYHVTEPGAWESMARDGLLSTVGVLELFGVSVEQHAVLTARRRPQAVPLLHARKGRVVLNDQIPLNEKKLASCLDDGLTPADWLKKLNERVFFWAHEDGLSRLLNAQVNRKRTRQVIVVDTLSLASAHMALIDICPINSGATIHQPARRGHSTFTPMTAVTYAAWRRQRGKSSPDKILEVTVRGGVPDIARHALELRTVSAGKVDIRQLK